MTLYWHGDKIKKKLKQAIHEGEYLTAEQILAEAVNNAPEMTGTLRRSGIITNGSGFFDKIKSFFTRSKKRVVRTVGKLEISFNTPYAYRQHEDLSLSHTGKGVYYTAGGKKEYIKKGGPKYLEKAWNKHIKNLERNIKIFTKRAGLL